jgi:oxaloacetate decarboxylase alpha subunit
MAITPLVPRISVRAARRKVPIGLVSAIDEQLRARQQGDRLDEVLDELERVRQEVGSPPLAAPIGQIVASQALINVLGANRYGTIVDELRDLVNGLLGRTPGPIDPALERAVERLGQGGGPPPVDLEALRERAAGLAASEEELLLLALFGDEAEPLLRSVRQRASAEETVPETGTGRDRDEQIRAVVRIVQETGIGEITVEEHGMRVSVRRTVDAPVAAVTEIPAGELDSPVFPPRVDGIVRIESPMVGTFYRAANPDAPPFVEEGDAVSPGQVLCILEAMKLMNEVKAELEGIVRKIHARDAEAVEYGQLLFEVEPVSGRPVGI